MTVGGAGVNHGSTSLAHEQCEGHARRRGLRRAAAGDHGRHDSARTSASMPASSPGASTSRRPRCARRSRELEADGLVEKLPLKGYRTTDLLDEAGAHRPVRTATAAGARQRRAGGGATAMPTTRPVSAAEIELARSAIGQPDAYSVLVAARRAAARQDLPRRAQRDRPAGVRAHALSPAHVPPGLHRLVRRRTPWTSTRLSRTPSSRGMPWPPKPRCDGTSSSRAERLLRVFD